MNTETTGTKTTGKARFVIVNDTMAVTIDVKDAPAGIEHWQHFHGFEQDGQVAGEATIAQDANGDGILDVEETGAVSGATMVPFNKIPAAINFGASTIR